MKNILFILFLFPILAKAQIKPGDKLTLTRFNDNGYLDLNTSEFVPALITLDSVHATVVEIDKKMTRKMKNGLWVIVTLKEKQGEYKLNVDKGLESHEIISVNNSVIYTPKVVSQRAKQDTIDNELDSLNNILVKSNKIQINYSPSFLLRGIVELDSVSSDQLFNRAKLWVQKAFVSPDEVILTEDEKNRIMICLCGFSFRALNGEYFENISGTGRLMLEFKDNRYRYTFSQVNCTWKNTTGTLEDWIETANANISKSMDSFANEVKIQTINQLLMLVTSLNINMKQVPKSDNW